LNTTLDKPEFATESEPKMYTGLNAINLTGTVKKKSLGGDLLSQVLEPVQAKWSRSSWKQPAKATRRCRAELDAPLTGSMSVESDVDIHDISLDHDYDSKSHHICQDLSPTKKDCWGKAACSLKGSRNMGTLDAFGSQVTILLNPGENGWVQVKVYEPHSNAVVKTVRV